MRGEIGKCWWADCWTCTGGTAFVAFHGSKDDAAADLRRKGWVTREGLWICEVCAPLYPRGAIVTQPKPLPGPLPPIPRWPPGVP
jgi:hypothetical protein